MFAVGDYIQYGNSGVCVVQEIVQGLENLSKDKKYYLLEPVVGGGRIYTPVENTKVVMRKILTPEEIKTIVEKMEEIPELWITDERGREQSYKKALHSGDCKEWIQIIKTLYMRKQKRVQQGKKVTSTDERYMKTVEERLYSEFAVSLGIEREDVKAYIASHIKSKAQE